VSLLTDYGTADEFVGVVKSVILDAAPHVRFVDVTHEIAPFDVRGGSLALCRAIQYLPEGIVVAVVDPGVGTQRRRIAVEVAGGAGILLGPDNGLLAPAVAIAGGATRAFELTNVELHLPAPGATFDGRDVFAPVAAFLCNGGDLADVGEPLDADLLVPGVVPLPSEVSQPGLGDGLRCEVTWVDRFGNCQLNIAPEDLAAVGAAGITIVYSVAASVASSSTTFCPSGASALCHPVQMGVAPPAPRFVQPGLKSADLATGAAALPFVAAGPESPASPAWASTPRMSIRRICRPSSPWGASMHTTVAARLSRGCVSTRHSPVYSGGKWKWPRSNRRPLATR
jgi:S-adenosylmethionine hydrolase